MITDNVFPQISVVMSIYNEPEEWLRESIESILNQTFSDFEFIIINDNPERQLNDALLNEYQKKDSRIVIIKNEENIGLTKSLNKGLEIAKGKYIARMDGDDVSLKDRFDKQINFLKKNPDISIIGSQAKMFGEKNGYLIVPRKSSEINARFFIFNPVIHSTVMMRREDLLKYNLKYNEEIQKSQDYDLWVRASKVLRIKNLNKVLIKYRVHTNQISNRNQDEQVLFANIVRINQLNSLNINLSQNELLIYTKFLENNTNLTAAEIQILDPIISAIIESNRSFVSDYKQNFEFLLLSRLTLSYIRNHFVKELKKTKTIHLIRLKHIFQWISYIMRNRLLLFTFNFQTITTLRND